MATAADILGLRYTPRVPERWSEAYERLCVQRDGLMARSHIPAESSSAKEDDPTDAACEESERGLCLFAASAAQDTLSEILAALRRIECGTYGICEITGQPIEPERLEAIPWARFSLDSQRELEHDGSAPRRALPTLRSLTEVCRPAEEGEAEEE